MLLLKNLKSMANKAIPFQVATLNPWVTQICSSPQIKDTVITLNSKGRGTYVRRIGATNFP